VIRLLTPLALVAVLSGCDVKNLAREIGENFEKNSDLPPLTLIVHAGAKMTLGDSAVPIQGNELCPPSTGWSRALFGPAPEEGKHTCIVVEPDTQSVTVKIWFPEGPSVEDWSVERTARNIVLRRADGSLIGF
jgi:hypothetical protein